MTYTRLAKMSDRQQNVPNEITWSTSPIIEIYQHLLALLITKDESGIYPFPNISDTGAIYTCHTTSSGLKEECNYV